MAEMNIAERRLPQDGRIPRDGPGPAVDIRVSHDPDVPASRSSCGCSTARACSWRSEKLGFAPARSAVESLIKRPHGIVLVTGADGLRQTTTLYGRSTRSTRQTERSLPSRTRSNISSRALTQIP